ncbi:MAG: hypothetical protein ACRDZO_21000 [Egibacteraceae bacterium]
MPANVLLISPVPAPLARIEDKRRVELERIFACPVHIIELSHLDYTPEQLAHEVRAAAPDAVVITSAPIEYRMAIGGIALKTPLLRPVHEQYRNHHGYIEKRLVGYGTERNGRVELLPNGALADRSPAS